MAQMIFMTFLLFLLNIRYSRYHKGYPMTMLEFSQRRRLRRMLYSKPVAIALLLLVGFLSYTTYGMYQTSHEAYLRKQTAAAKLADLEERQDFLTGEIARLKTDRGVEAEVRQKFDVAKEGEKVIVIVEEKATSTDDRPQKTGIWATVKNWFKK